MKIFTGILERHADIDAAFVRIPFSVAEVFGVKGQLRVKGTVNGRSFRGNLAPYGGVHYLGLTQAFRKEHKLNIGDVLEIEIEPDAEERVVELPADLKLALERNPAAKTFYENSSYTNRKEYVRWVTSSKRTETRESRIKKTVERLSEGLKFS